MLTIRSSKNITYDVNKQKLYKVHGKVGGRIVQSFLCQSVDNDGNMRINIRLIMQLDSPPHILDEVL